VRVSEFSFDTLLYEGSSTLVYGGTRDADGAPMVAKLVAGGRRDLTHEYLVLEKLAGPGVVEALGVFDSSSGPVLVQRRFGAGSLADALRGGSFTVPCALRVALQVAHVCARIHAARVIHRDIKPANILWDPDAGAIALADFGIAAELPVNARALPVGSLVGTPSYVSPEHTGRTSVGCDIRSDLYSLGVTLYELLTGTLPFPDRDALAAVAAHLSKMPVAPHHVVRSIPPVVSDIVMKLLAKLPDERYQSARGLAADLERCLATVGSDGSRFSLGGSDTERLRFPARLFGRGSEMAALEQALARAQAGSPTLVLVSGREGSGRSELVRALVRDIAPASPLALGGWLSANERPLFGLDDALTSLAHRLVRLEEDQLGALRRQFATRVGQVGQVVLDIAPALADVLGRQPPLVELPAAAARARLHHGFRCFAAAMGDDAPFVLALQGAEHADPATANLIEAVLSSPTSCRVLVVLLASEPSGFGALRERPGAVLIELGPLSVVAMTEWIAATLDCDLSRVAALGDALHERTAGNPLMFVRLLEHLVEIGVIARSDGVYAWSLDAVRATPSPPTLAALAAQRIAELDLTTRSVLAAVACSDAPTDAAALAAMLVLDVGLVRQRAVALEREGLVIGADAGYRVAHPAITETALAQLAPGDASRMRGRLGAHLLAGCGPAPSGTTALQVATALQSGTIDLVGPDRARAAELLVCAAEHVMASCAYAAAAALFAGAAALLDDDAWHVHRRWKFRIELGCARSLVMLGNNALADEQLDQLSRRDLSFAEIGLVYSSWMDNQSMVMDRVRAIEVGLEGLERLGIRVPAQPSKLRPLAAIRLNQRTLSRLSIDDHVNRPHATDERAVAAVKLLSSLATPALFTKRMGLYVMLAETAIGLLLSHGHLRNTSGFLAIHACFLHATLGQYAAARRIYQACEAIEAVRSSPELIARTYVVFHYMVSPWFGSWRDSAQKLGQAIRLGVEAGDPVFAALCASASVTMLNLIGTPLDQVVRAIEDWGPFLRGDGGVAANAANIVNIAGKLSRGEPIITDDLDRVSNVPLAAGPMRNNAMVNLGLALLVIGHGAQVRVWLDEIRDSFPQVNFSQPHQMTLWLLDGLFAAEDVRNGRPEHRADRRACALRVLDTFRALRDGTGATNNDPAIYLLEAQLRRADGDLDGAAGLFARAVREAAARDLTPIVAYAHEERARMLDEASCPDEATLFYREAVIAYRRWAHLTKVIELQQAHPELQARGLGRSDDPRGVSRFVPAATVAGTVGIGRGVNDQMDLVTVLKVSQDISTQLHGSGIVRAVLTGIAQNAGADRVVFVLRSTSGVETVYGEVVGGAYRDIDVALDSYSQLPRSVVRVVRRTGRPLVVGDAMSDPAHAADRFIVESRGRSIAGIPIRRKGDVAGLVVLENRMIAGAFTPQLVSLTQALVAQAAISLDNASLYQDLENRVQERTRALNTRNAEIRMVLDHVAQGLVIVGTDGRLLGERSAVLSTWFPEGVPDTLAGLFADDPACAARFELAWRQLIDGFLPLDLGIGQLPTQLRRGGRTLAVDWQPIVNGAGQLERMLVVLSDVTFAQRLAAAEREQHQLMAMFESLSEDRDGVVELLRNAAVMVGELASGTLAPEAERRLVHTLERNAGRFGLSALAARCLEIEDAMADADRGMTSDERHGLTAAWQALHHKASRFLDGGDGFLRVRRADLDGVLEALRKDGHPLAHDVELWGLEPIKLRFQRLGEQARGLAERLGKAPVRVHVEHGGVYIDGDAWAPFWSALAHVVRNAIDHGVEDAAERAALGKGIATLTLKSYLRAGTLVIEFSDDGRGIAWDRLRDKARASGLPTETRKDLIAALFHDGISTRDGVSQISGRGIGMSALAAVCRDMSCEIAVDSAPGQGTTLRFEVPAQRAGVHRERPVSRELVALPAG
jgi:predicted ATPase/HPt (histidine-containing phosphotransfer) domain-containing protein